MPNEEQMTLSGHWKHVQLIRKRYLRASKYQRGRLLDEMEAVTGLQRGSLIRITLGSVVQKPRHEQRGRT